MHKHEKCVGTRIQHQNRYLWGVYQSVHSFLISQEKNARFISGSQTLPHSKSKYEMKSERNKTLVKRNLDLSYAMIAIEEFEKDFLSPSAGSDACSKSDSSSCDLSIHKPLSSCSDSDSGTFQSRHEIVVLNLIFFSYTW